MILDAQTRLSDAQALTASAASTNYYDLGSDRDIGSGEPLAVLVSVDVAADATSGDETYAFALVTDDNTSFSSADTIMAISPGRAQLVAGSQWVIPIPYANERYIRLQNNLGGTTPSITITVDIVPMSMLDKKANYPSGF